MSIHETAMLLSGQLVRNHRGTFYFDKPGHWIDSTGLPLWEHLHRLDGPAAIYANGKQEWWIDGQLHRADGPAVIYSNGHQVWYLNGNFIK